MGSRSAKLSRRSILSTSGGVAAAIAALQLSGWDDPAVAGPSAPVSAGSRVPQVFGEPGRDAVLGELVSSSAGVMRLVREVNGPVTVRVRQGARLWRDGEVEHGSFRPGDLILALGDEHCWLSRDEFEATAVAAPPTFFVGVVQVNLDDRLVTDHGGVSLKDAPAPLDLARVSFLGGRGVEPVAPRSLKAGDQVLAIGRPGTDGLLVAHSIGRVRG